MKVENLPENLHLYLYTFGDENGRFDTLVFKGFSRYSFEGDAVGLLNDRRTNDPVFFRQHPPEIQGLVPHVHAPKKESLDEGVYIISRRTEVGAKIIKLHYKPKSTCILRQHYLKPKSAEGPVEHMFECEHVGKGPTVDFRWLRTTVEYAIFIDGQDQLTFGQPRRTYVRESSILVQMDLYGDEEFEGPWTIRNRIHEDSLNQSIRRLALI
eukprot:CAMPEP_0113862732 /NCGR_PEP_ID=MMETSP0372-20130328/15650_1 /TAXON_ID=340204 /ORGANISM="Lankesteria abbotti" /LENGTH=210 /DNA_ID=CAMNT_0000844267 /DNA_START=99 /DNA_END=731 /DNA_ORIENTATION=- /assembly_acc=CAM_ASM_000359